MEKACDQWEEMQVGQNTWQAFKNHFTQSYRCYYIQKKPRASAHGYGVTENHAQKIDSQMMTTDALQALENETI